MENILYANIIKTFGKEWGSWTTFSNKDAIGVLLHNNDLMVMTMQYDNWNVKRVLINFGSSTDILFYSSF